MTRRVSFLCHSASSETAGAVVVDGDCWLGPIQPGDRFQAAANEQGEREVLGDLIVVAVDQKRELSPGERGRLRLQGDLSLGSLTGRLLLGEVDRV
jgi:hypothetical protein